MGDHLAFMELVAEPTQRRCWLLYRALECLPIDQAIDWAQRADTFIASGRGGDITPQREPVTSAAPSARLIIATEQRRRLIDRLATGARNADLAAEFGLTPKQVQGVRIGCAREIARRRDAPQPLPTDPQPAAASDRAIRASVEEVVRFLRQQDDVVVPQASGEFLVNARFRLRLDELISRANRMRTRQGKPEFAVANGINGHAAAAPDLAAANGHPLAKVA
jgi:hypothetical protein